MRSSRWSQQGFSLIELLVVLAIVGIITITGVVMLGDRRSNSVRSVMDEVEGALMNAQKTALLTSRDVYVSTTGTWTAGTMVLDPRALNSTPGVVSFPPTTAELKAGDNTGKRIGSSSDYMASQYAKSRDHQSAGVDCGSGWYATARGSASDLKDVEPVKSDPAMVDAMGNRLFTGSDNSVVVNGLTRRFEKGFSVVVVGLRGGGPVPGGAVGVIIVPAKSSNVYKFYKPDGSVTWRRL